MCGFLLKKYGSKKQKRLLKYYYFVRKLSHHIFKRTLLQKYQNIMQRNGIYKEDECKLHFYKSYKKDVFIKGCFEDPTYFNDILPLLLKELTPKYPEKDCKKSLYDIIRNKESVCVSFRRWNEISSNETLLKSHDVCTKGYYEKAFDLMHDLHPDAVFIVFSNDIEFIKGNFVFKYKVYFESGKDEVYEKLRLMYSYLQLSSIFFLKVHDEKTLSMIKL